MRAIRTFLFVISIGFVAAVSLPVASRTDSGLPDGWIRAGSAPGDYDMGSDPSAAHTGKAGGYLKSKADKTTGFGTLMQMCKAEGFHGKRVRMSGWIKSADVTDWAGMWMRVDGPEKKMTAFDNMQKRAIKGTTDWTRYQIVLDVAPDAQDIAFGVLLSGGGQVWLDDMTFEVVDKKVALTSTDANAGGTLAADPMNLDFEK